MSYDFEKSNGAYGSASASVITAYPFTIGAWFKAESIADGDTIIALGQNADPVPFTRLMFNGSSQVVGYRRTFSGNNTGNLTVATTISTGTWYLALLVCSGRYSHQAFVGTTGSTEYTTDMEDWSSSNNLDKIGMGALYRGSGVQDYFDGLLAEYAIWTSALSSGDRSALAGGALANSVGTLAHWWRANSDQGSTLTDSIGSTSIAITNGASYVADHPSLNSGVSLAAGATAGATGSGALSVGSQLAVAAVARAIGSGALSVHKPLTAAAVAGAAGSAALSAFSTVWRIPTNAPNGTAVHVMVLNGASPTYGVVAQGPATVAGGYADLPGSGSAGTKAFAYVSNYNDNTAVASIRGGPSIATLTSL